MRLSQMDLESKSEEAAESGEQKRQEDPQRATVEAEMQALQTARDAFMFVIKVLHSSCPLLKQPSRAKSSGTGFASRLRASAGAGAAAGSTSNAAVASAAAAQAAVTEWGAREVHDLDLLDESGQLLQLLSADNRDRRASELLQLGSVYILASSAADSLEEPAPEGVPATVSVGAPAVGAGRAKTPPKGAKKGAKGGSKPSPKSASGSHGEDDPPAVAYTPLLFTAPWSEGAAPVPSGAASAKSSKKGGKGKGKK